MNTPDAPGSLILFSNTVPIDSTGSFVIFRRHLLPLVEQGWTLTIASYFAPPEGSIFWRHVRLPLRQRFWPPATLPLFPLWGQKLRALLLTRFLVREGVFSGPSPRVLLANLWDSQALAGAAAARAGLGRLGVFLHDDEILWNDGAQPRRELAWRRQQVTAAAGRIWSVSDRLVSAFAPPEREKCRILRPIPARSLLPAPEWRAEFAAGVRLGYAGKVYPGLWPLLERLVRVLAQTGGTCTLITDPSAIATAPFASPALQLRPYFPTAEESILWLRANCSALLVAHPLSADLPEGRWQILKSSFPSKLTEYAQLGLPLVLCGNEDSEFATWARQQAGIPFFKAPDSPECIGHLENLRQPQGWSAGARAVQRLAREEFDPEFLQRDFASDILALAGARPPIPA